MANMKKRVIGGFIVIGMALTVAGCGNTIPEMTQEQQELVVEYAAGVVLKYDKNHESKLVELTLEEDVVAEDVIAQEETPSLEAEEANETEANEVTVIDNTEDINEITSIEEFLQLDAVRFTYMGYEVSEFYPDDIDNDGLYFIMNATDGNKLLVLKFLAENISDTEMEFNMVQSNIRFKIVVNEIEKNALTTMLLNDLAFYQGSLASGETTELVLICEVSDEQSEAISSLSLVMKSVDDTATISLY